MPINNVAINASTPLASLLSYAQSEIVNVNVGQEFMVRDLFLGYEWNRIPVGIRTKLGGAFFIFAQGFGSGQLNILNKTPQNQQRYSKK